MNKHIKIEIAEQYNKVYYLNRVLVETNRKLEELIIKRSDELFERINAKVPKIIKIPLFYTYFGGRFEDSHAYEEAISEFKDYAMEHELITSKELESIKNELEELYYMADTLVYHMYLTNDHDTFDVTYHCVAGCEVTIDVEYLSECFADE